MKTRKRILSIVLTIATLLLLVLDIPVTAAGTKKVDVLFTHDTHSHLDSFSTIVDGQQKEVGGFAKIKTLMDEKKKDNPDTLVLDGGDFSMGTLIQTVYDTEAAELRMLGYLGYDVTTFGNHEYDYRSKGLANMLKAAINSGETVPEIAVCNVDWDAMEKDGLNDGQKQIKEAFEAYGVKDYVVVQKGDTRIAVVGVFGKDALVCAPTCELVWKDPVKAAKQTVEKIKKVTSGSTPEIGKKVNEVYASVITAGTHLAPTMKVAEAAKVIENSQRDINIAFVNELSKIFTKMGIDTQDVLEAASTKWNFLPFKPGLVGGHCIGVDPYYLAQCAQRHGYNPEIILAGRRMNDGMGEYVANQVAKLMLKKGIQVLNSHILILGFTFKENCPDVRNTKVIDIYNALREYNVHITVYDPWANPDIVMREYGISVTNQHPLDKKFDAAIIAVAHEQFIGFDVKTLLNAQHVIFDVKAIFEKNVVDGRL